MVCTCFLRRTNALCASTKYSNTYTSESYIGTKNHLSRTLGFANSCWIFFIPTKWYDIEGHFIADDCSIKSLALHSWNTTGKCQSKTMVSYHNKTSYYASSTMLYTRGKLMRKKSMFFNKGKGRKEHCNNSKNSYYS